MSSLSTYRRKRRFSTTPEPKPGRKCPSGGGRRFVVQKHDATRLHYDFRLEIDGVMKSWAVPKGPSLDPADKRLAMETEDHPLEYADFEGAIPEGNYGAGPVIIWDRGTFEPVGDVPISQQYRQGKLKFILRGSKLRGSFVLVRLRRPHTTGKPWLLIKHRDSEAHSGWKIEHHDGSVVSGRSLCQVKEGLPASGTGEGSDPGRLVGARKAPMPQIVHPMLATLVDEPFTDPEWLFEIKWDGVRALAWLRRGSVQLCSRTGRVITHRYPELASLPKQVQADEAILDGEIVVLDDDGRSNFERLQARINITSPSSSLQRQAPVLYCLFDLIYCDGYDLRHTPLLSRKQLLRHILKPGLPFVYGDHQLEKGRELTAVARKKHLEGIIGKRMSSLYWETRSRDWVKFKLTRELEAAIGGYTAPRSSRRYFGALLLGLYEGESLRFIGGAGTGFDIGTQKAVYEELKRLRSADCPFDHAPRTREKAYWVKPKLAARVRYANWTQDGRLRAPVLILLPKDRKARDCQFSTETPVPVSTALTRRTR